MLCPHTFLCVRKHIKVLPEGFIRILNYWYIIILVGLPQVNELDWGIRQTYHTSIVHYNHVVTSIDLLFGAVPTYSSV